MEWHTDPKTDGGLEGWFSSFEEVNLPEHWVSKKNFGKSG